ncbi:MAG: glycosyl hydrolase [Gemmatimonadota bacterium]
MRGKQVRSSRQFAGIVAISLPALACSHSTGPADPLGPDDPSTPPAWSHEAIQIAFSEAALRSGSLGGRSLHCGGPLARTSEYEEYVDAFADRPPVMWVDYYSLVDARFTPAERVALLEGHLAEYGGIPFVGISYTGTGVDGKPRGWDAEVAAGLFDDEIRMIARAVAEDGRPFFVRPGFEFNGTWNAYQPDTYRTSFVRIRTLFLEEGAANAIWVWNAHPAGTVAPFMEFYPGDEHVDWWGINLFGTAFDSAVELAFTAEFLTAAGARGKPAMIPESIPHKFHLLDDPTTWDAWFVPYFDLIESAEIGAFCFANRDYTQVPAWSDWGDLRIESSPLKDEWVEVLGQAWVVNGN